MSDYHIRTTCRLCDSDQLELVLDLGETALANEVWDDPNEQQDTFPLRLVQCGACGHMQNPVVVNPERLFRSYAYESGLSPVYREHLDEYAEQVEEFLEPDELVVEIGGNDGYFGQSLAANIRHLNVDPSDTVGKFGTGSHRKHIREFFTSDLARRLRSEFGSAKAIVANHVFAHVDDLHDMAEGVRELLDDDGTFWCEVGDGPWQLNSGCLDCLYHEHLSFHDEQSFAQFMGRHNLHVIKCERVGAQGQSLRFQLKRDKLVVNRYPHSLFDLPRIKAAAGHLRGLGEIIKSIEYGSSEYNRSDMAFFGAPAKLTTLLALMGLDKNFFKFGGGNTVFDDSPRKQGRYTPGTHIPISAPVPELMNRYDFMLVASWNFADDIIKRFPGYTGTWIVPLPEVRFVKGGGA